MFYTYVYVYITIISRDIVADVNCIVNRGKSRMIVSVLNILKTGEASEKK